MQNTKIQLLVYLHLSEEMSFGQACSADIITNTDALVVVPTISRQFVFITFGRF